MQRVLIIGATGNIGTSAVIAAVKSGYEVLALVRNQASAEKLFKNVGSSKGITTIIADITVDGGIKEVVDKVRAGDLPSFQHVYTAAGGPYNQTSLTDLSYEELQENLNLAFLPNFFAYRDTIPYLLEQQHPDSTWTICTGSQGTSGERAGPAMTQGALFSMVAAGVRQTTNTNVRVNEIYLSLRVEVDDSAIKTNNYKSSDFARVYQTILSDRAIKDSRVSVEEERDFDDLKVHRVEGAFLDWSTKFGQKVHSTST